jgi:type IV secretory pathway VirB2 component (pilin)
MRESLQRRCRPWRFNEPRQQRSTEQIDSEYHASPVRSRLVQVSRIVAALLTAVLLAPAMLLAQSPWERAASNLEQTFTGPLARSLALVAIVIGGLMFMFGEAGAKRQISGIVFGGGLALFAAQFLTWIF